jgi:CRP-like cAMP-binding protein
MCAMKAMLSLSAHLPEVRIGAGEVLVHEGGTPGSVWVLVSGRLRVCKGQVEVNQVDEPGMLIGEISSLLGSAYTATVQAVEPTVLRYAADGPGLLASHPEIMRLVAVGLAGRLHVVTTYLADLKTQYGDAPGLSMVSEVLNRLARHEAPLLRPGSVREPDPDY